MTFNIANRQDLYVDVSSMPTELFPDNTPYKFEVDLGDILQVPTSSEWEVAVTRFTYPFAWNTLDTHNLPFIMLAYGSDFNDRSRNAKGPTQTVTLPQGTYTNADDLVKTLEACVSFSKDHNSRPTQQFVDIAKMFNMRVLKGINQVQMGVKYRFSTNTGVGQFAGECLWIQYSQQFGDVFGLPLTNALIRRRYALYGDTEVVGRRIVNFFRNVTEIAVDCT